ncbi:YkgJ family cysteine cluster protein [Candidatus Bathyarchaeota archaeon]|nr:YkgJ family cysteine cluster protein [Candidatus Bathyarchaeota archaeon]
MRVHESQECASQRGKLVVRRTRDASGRILVLCSRCGKCCHKTEMELSSKDVQRLEEAGFCREEFTLTGEDDVTRLRNVGESCFFYDVSEKRCRVYAYRPLGCHLYPVIYSVDDNVMVVDDLCPMGKTVSEYEVRTKGRILVSLLKTIDDETETRQSKKSAS